MKHTQTNFVLLALLMLIGVSCKTTPAKQVEHRWSVKMMQSEMTRFPAAYQIEKATTPRWGYTHGCVAKAALDLFKHTGDSTYYCYAKGYADSLITSTGEIKTYRLDKYNIDNINPGKILFSLYQTTGDERYKIAIDTLVKQMQTHPRTKEGGFWHKQIYTHQMWLDGLYMAAPFLAEYANTFNQPALFDEVINQLTLMDSHSYDPKSGLFYHGWDESKTQQWADKTTGHSPNFWSRSIGWYAMALVDVLDFIPVDHPRRGELLLISNRLAAGITKWQDQATGVWYQVTDQGAREGNYLESSGSAMFVYFLYKATTKNYIDHSYQAAADKGFQGLLTQFIKQEQDSTYSITNCCSVAGLGGEKRYRDGSFEYYISEPVIDNDPKSVAPFIWAAIAQEERKQTDNKPIK